MPTENRSSNTEMVSAPTLLAADSDRDMLEYLAEAVETQTYGCDQCGHEEPLSTFDIASDLRDYMLAFPRATAPQPHPEPIAWMVGTAIWWTKEEAERDAAATGLPVVPVGPMFDTGEVERQKSRADTDALNHRHAKNAIGDIKAYVERLVAASNGQPSVATGYLSDIVTFIVERTKGDPTETSDINALRLELQDSRRNEFNACAQLTERDALLRGTISSVRLDSASNPNCIRRRELARLAENIEAALSASAEQSAPAEVDEPVCKGAWQLGTACGKCRRCQENPSV